MRHPHQRHRAFATIELPLAVLIAAGLLLLLGYGVIRVLSPTPSAKPAHVPGQPQSPTPADPDAHGAIDGGTSTPAATR